MAPASCCQASCSSPLLLIANSWWWPTLRNRKHLRPDTAQHPFTARGRQQQALVDKSSDQLTDTPGRTEGRRGRPEEGRGETLGRRTSTPEGRADPEQPSEPEPETNPELIVHPVDQSDLDKRDDIAIANTSPYRTRVGRQIKAQNIFDPSA